MEDNYSDEVHTWMCWCCRKEFKTDWKRFKIHLEKCECERVGKEHFPAEDAL